MAGPKTAHDRIQAWILSLIETKDITPVEFSEAIGLSNEIKAERDTEIISMIDEMIERYKGKGRRHLEGEIALRALKTRIQQLGDIDEKL